MAIQNRSQFEKMAGSDIFKFISNAPRPFVKKTICLSAFVIFLSTYCNGQSQQVTTKDSIVYRITYRDTVIYKYDTVQIRHYVHADTLWSPASVAAAHTPAAARKKKVINPNNFGIGPSVGAYYSPFNGFDINIGFGVQYYFLSIPTIRKPHLRHHRK